MLNYFILTVIHLRLQIVFITNSKLSLKSVQNTHLTKLNYKLINIETEQNIN